MDNYDFLGLGNNGLSAVPVVVGAVIALAIGLSVFESLKDRRRTRLLEGKSTLERKSFRSLERK